jgi:hypothetical protein
MPWASVAAGWGCTVPVPASWHSFLQAAASEAAPEAAASSLPGSPAVQLEPKVTLEDLSCPLELAEGPAALQLGITTPYGLAQATIEPQHMRAALLSSECREVLAVPAARSCAGIAAAAGELDSSTRRPVGFSWTVASQLPLGQQPTAGVSKPGNSSTGGSLAAMSPGSSRRTSFTFEAGTAGVVPTADGAVGLAAGRAAGSFNGRGSHLTVQHTVEAYAAVRLAVVRNQSMPEVNMQPDSSVVGRAQPHSSQVVEPRTPTVTLAGKAAATAALTAAETEVCATTVGSGGRSSAAASPAMQPAVCRNSMAGRSSAAACMIPHHLQLLLCAAVGAAVAVAATYSWAVAALLVVAAVAIAAAHQLHNSSSSSTLHGLDRSRVAEAVPGSVVGHAEDITQACAAIKAPAAIEQQLTAVSNGEIMGQQDLQHPEQHHRQQCGVVPAAAWC